MEITLTIRDIKKVIAAAIFKRNGENVDPSKIFFTVGEGDSTYSVTNLTATVELSE